MSDTVRFPTRQDPERLLREIDMQRLKALAAQPPVMPTVATPEQTLVRAQFPQCHGLIVWEQAGPEQQLYVPPADRYNVFLRLEGSTAGVVQWREGELDVRSQARGEAVVVPPCSAAYFRSTEPCRNLHFSFEGSLLRAAAQGARVGPRLPNCFGLRDAVLAELAQLTLIYLRTPGAASDAFLHNIGMALAVRLLERMGKTAPLARGRLSRQQLAFVDEYLEHRLDGTATLSEMAALLDMNPFQFLRQFKATVGVPPLRHAMKLRMSQARRLVESTHKPLVDIACELGFGDPSHFSRTFRKHWGVNPSDLRAHR